MKITCINTSCSMLDTCVHAIEYNKVSDDETVVMILNPKSQVMDADGKCQHYCAQQKVVYAYGFMNEMKKMTHQEYTTFTKILIRTFNRTDFYAMRNGAKSISPERQQEIISAASSIGYTFSANAWDRMEEVME